MSVYICVSVFVHVCFCACVQDKGVVPELFQDPACFHLTLGVLRIFSDEEKVKNNNEVLPLDSAQPTYGVICGSLNCNSLLDGNRIITEIARYAVKHLIALKWSIK